MPGVKGKVLILERRVELTLERNLENCSLEELADLLTECAATKLATEAEAARLERDAMGTSEVQMRLGQEREMLSELIRRVRCGFEARRRATLPAAPSDA